MFLLSHTCYTVKNTNNYVDGKKYFHEVRTRLSGQGNLRLAESDLQRGRPGESG